MEKLKAIHHRSDAISHDINCDLDKKTIEYSVGEGSKPPYNINCPECKKNIVVNEAILDQSKNRTK